jgi:hypothetical protein
MGFPNFNSEDAPETVAAPSQGTSDAASTKPEDEDGSPSSSIIEDSLKQLRLRRYSQAATSWFGETSQESSEELEGEARAAASEEEVASQDEFPEDANLGGAGVTVVSTEEQTADSSQISDDASSEVFSHPLSQPALDTIAEPVASEAEIEPPIAERQFVEEESRLDAIGEKQNFLATEAAQRTGRALEQMANIAADQLRQMLGQVANAAVHQTNAALERLVEDGTERTVRLMEKLSVEASAQVRQELLKLAEDAVTPPLSASVSDLSGEVRRVGRELFKTVRAAERNQDLFDSAVSEIQRLTSRIEQVPAQLHGSESITEVKAALCRELLGLADALEASLATAHETLEQLLEPEEENQGAGLEEVPEQPQQSVLPSETQPFWRVFLHNKLQQWASRVAPPLSSQPPSIETSPPEGVDEEEEGLEEAMDVMRQWLDGQQLIYDRLQMVMQNAGVRQIETEGQTFDPARHRAVSVETRNDVPSGTITGEERRGYTLDGRILRYAEVIVAKNEQNSWD